MRKRTLVIILIVMTALSSCRYSVSDTPDNTPLYGKLSSDGECFLAVNKNDELITWGYNGAHVLPGMPDIITNKQPFVIMKDAKSASCGQWTCLAVDQSGNLWCWGSNLFGQYGNGTVGDSTKKDDTFIIMYDVKNAYADSEHCAALKQDGTLWTWGKNEKGQLGTGGTADSPSPVKIIEDVKSVCASGSATFAIKNDGSLWGCGDIGIPDKFGNSYRNTPVKIMNNVRSVSGSGTVLAVKNDNTLWAWGYPETPGNNMCDYFNKGVPVKIMDGVRSAGVFLGNYAAIKTDGSLWTWGANYGGQLGDGTNIDRATPEKVFDGVECVAISLEFIVAMRKDGSLWASGTYVSPYMSFEDCEKRNEFYKIYYPS